MALQEADLAEYEVATIEALFKRNGKEICFGRSVPLENDDAKRMGRRVALVSEVRTRDLSADVPEIEALAASGRWLEREIILGDGQSRVMMAVYYGISGANNKRKRVPAQRSTHQTGPGQNEILRRRALLTSNRH